MKLRSIDEIIKDLFKADPRTLLRPRRWGTKDQFLPGHREVFRQSSAGMSYEFVTLQDGGKLVIVSRISSLFGGRLPRSEGSGGRRCGSLRASSSMRRARASSRGKVRVSGSALR